MENAQKKNLFFGASITMTTENLHEITDDAFLDDLQSDGCKVVIYVEFVPVSEESSSLAPGDNEREYLSERLAAMREKYPDMVFVSFPGDEESAGGCLAAGRASFSVVYLFARSEYLCICGHIRVNDGGQG